MQYTNYVYYNYLIKIYFFYRVNLEEYVFRKVETGNTYNSTSNINDSSSKLMWWSISRDTCLIVFAVLTLMVIVLTFIRSFTFVSVSMQCSMTLHNKMFNAITKATMHFFNTNSSGKNSSNMASKIYTI